jgi:hypothetical protein
MRAQKACVFLGVLALCVLTLTFLGAEARATLPGPAQGDADGNGRVDQADLATVLNHYNQSFDSNAWAYGDFNSDGLVNGADFNVVLSNYNQGTTSSNLTAAVPEPGTLLLLGTCLLGLLAYGWRKRR